MAFKMKSGSTGPMYKNYGVGEPLKKYGNSSDKAAAVKQTYDAAGSDERVYDVNQDKYDDWAAKTPGAPDVRYLGSKENNKFLEAYLDENPTGDKGKKPTKGDELKKANPPIKPKQPKNK